MSYPNNLPKHVQSIIFDCDGTLVETEYQNTVSFAKILQEYGLESIDVDMLLTEYKGLSLQGMQAKVFEDYQLILPDNWIAHFRSTREQHFTQVGIQPVEGITELLSILKNKQIDFCVASQARLKQTNFSLQLSKLEAFFPEHKRFSAEQVANPKPASDLFLHALTTCGFNLENTIVIEDSLVGVQAGISSGIYTIGFTKFPEEKQTFLDLGVNQVISCISELHPHFSAYENI